MSAAMACDLAIAAERTVFSFGYTQIGASSDLGLSLTLPSSVGLRRAMGIALLGESIDAEEAFRIGMINKVVADDGRFCVIGSLSITTIIEPPSFPVSRQFIRHSATRDPANH